MVEHLYIIMKRRRFLLNATAFLEPREYPGVFLTNKNGGIKIPPNLNYFIIYSTTNVPSAFSTKIPPVSDITGQRPLDVKLGV